MLEQFQNNILKFIIMNESFDRSHRRLTLGQSITEKRYKLTTFESRVSKNSRMQKQFDRWQNHQVRRENRISSMLRARKDKLEQITDQNQKIFIRINQQQSYYPSINCMQNNDKSKTKETINPQKSFGPIGFWQPPACFIVGSRGIMCEQKSGFGNMLLRHDHKLRLPSLGKLEPIQKQNSLYEPTSKGTRNYYTPNPANRSRHISDLYMMV